MGWRDYLKRRPKIDRAAENPDLFLEIHMISRAVGGYKRLWDEETDNGNFLESFLNVYDPEGVKNLRTVLAQLFEMCELIIKYDPKKTGWDIPEATNDPNLGFDTVYHKAKEVSAVIDTLITGEKPYNGPDALLYVLREIHLKNYIDAYETHEKEKAQDGGRIK